MELEGHIEPGEPIKLWEKLNSRMEKVCHYFEEGTVEKKPSSEEIENFQKEVEEVAKTIIDNHIVPTEMVRKIFDSHIEKMQELHDHYSQKTHEEHHHPSHVLPEHVLERMIAMSERVGKVRDTGGRVGEKIERKGEPEIG